MFKFIFIPDMGKLLYILPFLGFVDHRDVIVPQIFLLPFVLSDLLWVKVLPFPAYLWI